MLGPQHIPLFVRYLDGIDEHTSRKMLRTVPPSEVSLTEEFCSLMDLRNQRRERALPFDADSLTDALVDIGGDVHFDVRIDARQYTQPYEGYVSQADFGLVIEYNNHVLPNRNWDVAYLMQAKRLMPGAGGAYDATSNFASLRAAQQGRMRRLRDVLGPTALKYFLYCPPTTGYDDDMQGVIRALHTANLATLIFDFTVGLALHQHVKENGGIENGLWVTDVIQPPSNATTLHARAFHAAQPFTWFFLDHFDQPARGHFNADGSWGNPDPEHARRTYGIATGDEAIIKEVLDELDASDPPPAGRPDTFKILPANTVVIGVSSGPGDVPVKIDDEAPPPEAEF